MVSFFGNSTVFHLSRTCSDHTSITLVITTTLSLSVEGIITFIVLNWIILLLTSQNILGRILLSSICETNLLESLECNLSWPSSQCIFDLDNVDLVKPFEGYEIWEAIWSMGYGKSPIPDGFTVKFYRSCSISDSMWYYFNHFYHTSPRLHHSRVQIFITFMGLDFWYQRVTIN